MDNILMYLSGFCFFFSLTWAWVWFEVWYLGGEEREEYNKKNPWSKIWLSRLNKVSLVSFVLGAIFLIVRFYLLMLEV